jgi:alpha-L-fucosidase 2
MKNNLFAVCLALSSFCTGLSAADLSLWYQQPAADNQPMNEALPIGNGRMGALIFGAPARERLCLNEDSLWTGTDNPSGEDGTMGSYQVLGNVFVNLPAHTNSMDYRRDLDLADAIARVSYSANGVKFQRTFFSSHPAEVTVAQFTADKNGAYTGSIELRDGHDAKVVLNGNRFTVSGALNNGRKYEWQVLVLNHGGTVTADTNSARLEFKDCDSLTLLVAAGTDYVMDYEKLSRRGPARTGDGAD